MSRAGGLLLLLVGLGGGWACRRSVVTPEPRELAEGMPCQSDSDCKVGDRCRDLGGRRTCQHECVSSWDCPTGYECDPHGTCQQPPQ